MTQDVKMTKKQWEYYEKGVKRGKEIGESLERKKWIRRLLFMVEGVVNSEL